MNRKKTIKQLMKVISKLEEILLEWERDYEQKIDECYPDGYIDDYDGDDME